MEFRFLFVDQRGEEVYVHSLEALAEHVRSGTLREETLLYDASTREWAPARSHPAFRSEAKRDGHTTGDAPDGPTGGTPPATSGATEGSTPRDEAGVPELAPLPEDESTIDTVRAFFEDRERERKEELRDRDGVLKTAPFLANADDAPTRSASPGWGDAPPQPGDPGYASFSAARGSEPLSPLGADPDETARELLVGATAGAPRISRRRAGGRRVSGRIARWSRRTRARSRQRSRDAAPRQAALFILLMVVGGWGIADAWGVSALEATDLEDQVAEAAALASSPLVPSMEAAKSGAFDDMVRGMEALRARMRVDEPPETWMGGPYLANALGYPDVRHFWDRYLEYTEAIREQEEDLFRSGFVSRLQAQGIAGPVLSIRLARALRDFRADRPRRSRTYAAMEELGGSAIDLHDFLVDYTDNIHYAPVDQGVTDDPILEAVPVDETTREALWGHINRLVDALDAVAGEDPLDRRNVSRRVLGDLAIPDAAPDSLDGP